MKPSDRLRLAVLVSLTGSNLLALSMRSAHVSKTHFKQAAGVRSQSIAGALRQSSRQADKAAFMFIDLDGFKGINDAHLQDAGDEVLKVAAM